MRGAPQVGFSAAIRKIRARTSLLTRLRPPTRLILETHVQYNRKPARCQPTTVLGVTRMRGRSHPDQSFRKTTQKSLCRVVSRRRGRLACNARTCARRARFSRMRFSRELKALTAYPMRCRIMTKIMARILSKLVASGRLQVIHYMSARGFDEGQPYGKVWRAGANEATAIPRIGKAEQE